MSKLLPSSQNQSKEIDCSCKQTTGCHIKDGQAWFLVHCKPNAERIALRNFENQKISAFLPLQKMTHRKGTTFQTLIKPLFPGYIFVAQDPFEGQWQKINNTRGVVRLVCLAGKPSPMPFTIMHQLFVRCYKKSVFQENSSLVATS